ncbi:GMC oxidoreductase [Pyrenophora teres f. maculata]|nr:GMC oxidoreductase [Pyrenophora teres f. maculata]
MHNELGALTATSKVTPHLLIYSGIGPEDVLEATGILVRKIAPEPSTCVSVLTIPASKNLAVVGSNSQDHVANYINFEPQNLNPENTYAQNTNATFNQTAYDRYLKSHTSPYSVGKANGLVFIAPQHFASNFNKTISKLESRDADVMVALTRYNRKYWASAKIAQ